MDPALAEIIANTPLTGLKTFLITHDGRAFKPQRLNLQFRRWFDQASIPHQFTLHGLRHALGDALAEAGSNPNEIASVLGHASAKTAMHYTQGADRKVMARKAMARLIGTKVDHSSNPEVSKRDPDLTLTITQPLKDQSNG
jgi:integrase